MLVKRIVVLSFLLIFAIGIVNAQSDDQPVTFTVHIENIGGIPQYDNAGVQAIPVGAEEAGPATPGNAYEWTFSAAPGDYLSFVSMLGQSNDTFFAPHPGGIALFDIDGNPVSGDVTDQIDLWDAGTEVNEELGVGETQAPRQEAPNTGTDENGVVDLAPDLSASDYIVATLTSNEDGSFTIHIENISENAAVPSPLSPIVWVVHHDAMMMGDEMMDDDMSDESMSDDEMTDESMSDDEMADEDMSDESMSDDEMMDSEMMSTAGVFFTHGEPDRGKGLEAVAEDGNPAVLAAYISGADFATPIAPVVWAVHDGMMESGAFFTVGEVDRGAGLEHAAEDGDPTVLAGNLEGMYTATGVINTPVDAEEAGPATPGNSYLFSFEAFNGDALSFATMFGQSNDWFFAPGEAGIALFDDNGNPVSGDVTKYVYLWDAGTEVDEEPGAGENQAPRQAEPNTGETEGNPVQLVSEAGDGFSVPPVVSLIRVTIHADDGMMME